MNFLTLSSVSSYHSLTCTQLYCLQALRSRHTNCVQAISTTHYQSVAILYSGLLVLEMLNYYHTKCNAVRKTYDILMIQP